MKFLIKKNVNYYGLCDVLFSKLETAYQRMSLKQP